MDYTKLTHYGPLFLLRLSIIMFYDHMIFFFLKESHKLRKKDQVGYGKSQVQQHQVNICLIHP